MIPIQSTCISGHDTISSGWVKRWCCRSRGPASAAPDSLKSILCQKCGSVLSENAIWIWAVDDLCLAQLPLSRLEQEDDMAGIIRWSGKPQAKSPIESLIAR